jgi:peptide/nickel transport system permease protein
MADLTRRARVGRWLSRLARTPGLVAAIAFLSLVAVAAGFPQALATTDPLATDPANLFAPPSAEHWFGTDYIGRDVYARVVYGAALSLRATLVALSLAFVLSAIIGLLAGFCGGLVDAVLMRVVDVLLAIPGLLIALVLITALGFGTLNVAIAVGAGSVAGLSRVMRAEVLRTSTSPFVEAARASGARWHTILWRHVLPHAKGPVLALTALEFGTAVLAIAGLSFLGFGAELPTPEWGNLVAEGRNYMGRAWWMTVLPGLVIVVTVVCGNRLARGFGHSPGQPR